METKEINDFKVKTVPVPPLPSIDEIQGGKLFGELYINCFLLARKKSGKTTVLSSIILNLVGKKTNVIFFVPTINKDASYNYILDKLDRKNINYQIFTDIIDENGTDVLDNLIEGLLAEEPEKPRKKKNEPEIPKPFNLFQEEKVEKKEREPKKKYPRFILVIDDNSNSTRSPSVSRLLKVHRHLKMCCFISSQSPTDLQPSSWRQLDRLLVFGGFSNNIEKLRAMYINMDLPMEFEEFLQYYRNATAEPYNFLWCSKDGTMRKNFNRQYL